MRALMAFALMAMCTGTLAASLPSISPWLNDNNYNKVVQVGDRLVAVGDRGAVLLSFDQGQTWERTTTPTDVLLTDVCFADEQHGWAVGHDALIMATTDGGESWQVQYTDPLGGEPIGMQEDEAEDLSFDDDDFGDGDELAFPVDTSGAPLLGVWCDPSTDDHVIAVGGFGYFLETRDGGNVWHKDMQRLSNTDGWNVYALESLPDSGGAVVAVGEKGSLFMSRDFGRTFEKLVAPYSGSFFGVTAVSARVFLIYGLEGNIWLTNNAGQGWVKVNSQITSGINGGTVRPDGSIVLVGNDGNLLKSFDEGQTFSQQVVLERESLTSVLSVDGNALVVTSVEGIHLVSGK